MSGRKTRQRSHRQTASAWWSHRRPSFSQEPPSRLTPTTPTTTPQMVIAEPKGPTCDATVKSVPTGPGSLTGLAKAQSSAALASIPAISTFSNAISGQVNPEVNVAAVLDNGPYIVFAPSDAACREAAAREAGVAQDRPGRADRAGVLPHGARHPRPRRYRGHRLHPAGQAGDQSRAAAAISRSTTPRSSAAVSARTTCASTSSTPCWIRPRRRPRSPPAPRRPAPRRPRRPRPARRPRPPAPASGSGRDARDGHRSPTTAPAG